MQRKYKNLPRPKRGCTPWIPRSVQPVRPGWYDCIAWFTSSAPSSIWRLYWDGKGFKVPIPLVVDYWRGQTLAAVRRATQAAKQGDTQP